MKFKIVVADDDISILEVIKIVLEQSSKISEKFEVVTISSGDIAKQIIQLKPKLVLLDIWMSGVDGREVTKMLKSSAETKDIPVIVISAHGDTKKMAEEAGADDFLSKPFELDQLIKKVERYIIHT